VTGLLFDFIGVIWMFLVLAGFILGFRKNPVLSQAGKSAGCVAFFLTTWAVFYNTAYPHDTGRVGTTVIPYLTDIWRWLPAVVLAGILSICLLIIWKPFSKRVLFIVVSSLAGVIIAISVTAVLTWENFGALNPQYWHTTAHIDYNETLLQEFMRIAHWESGIYLITSIVAIIMYMCFRKNPIASRIGKSILCAFPLFAVWSAATDYFSSWTWLISIVCIMAILACLFFIWKHFIFRKQVAEEKRPYPNGVPKRDKIVLAAIALLVIVLIVGYYARNIVLHMPQSGNGNVTAVYAGFWNSMAITDDGSLWAWGSNKFSLFGDDITTSRNRPEKILDDVIAISAGSYHAAAIRSDGSLWAWGRNWYGELGDGTIEERHSPVKITDDVIAVSAAGSYTMAIRSDGSLWAWGENRYGKPIWTTW